jgi:hypothetical protein
LPLVTKLSEIGVINLSKGIIVKSGRAEGNRVIPSILMRYLSMSIQHRPVTQHSMLGYMTMMEHVLSRYLSGKAQPVGESRLKQSLNKNADPRFNSLVVCLLEATC